MEILNKIQKELKAPKNQYNKFGNYNYRSCEDILEAVKPLLGTAILIITDEIIMIGNRFYVKATVTIADGKLIKTTSAFAREAENKKGMDEAQITGAASSYARKYALNGLFCIDDTKDADANNKHEDEKLMSESESKACLEKYKSAILGTKTVEQLDKYSKTVSVLMGKIREKYKKEANDYYNIRKGELKNGTN